MVNYALALDLFNTLFLLLLVTSFSRVLYVRASLCKVGVLLSVLRATHRVNFRFRVLGTLVRPTRLPHTL